MGSASACTGCQARGQRQVRRQLVAMKQDVAGIHVFAIGIIDELRCCCLESARFSSSCSVHYSRPSVWHVTFDLPRTLAYTSVSDEIHYGTILPS